MKKNKNIKVNKKRVATNSVEIEVSTKLPKYISNLLKINFLF